MKKGISFLRISLFKIFIYLKDWFTPQMLLIAGAGPYSCQESKLGQLNDLSCHLLSLKVCLSRKQVGSADGTTFRHSIMWHWQPAKP